MPSTQSIRWVKIKTKMFGSCVSVGFNIVMEDSRLHVVTHTHSRKPGRPAPPSTRPNRYRPISPSPILYLVPGSWSLAFVHVLMSMTPGPCAVGCCAAVDVDVDSAIKGHRIASLSTS